MNGAHIHLAVNHFPLVALFLGLGVLAAGLWRKNGEWQKVALGLLVVGGLAMAPTFFSGEEAEEVVENRPGISEALIHHHEEAAEPAALVTAVVGVAAAAALFVLARGGTLPAWGLPALLALGLAALGLVGRAASFGGQINHPEIRDAAPPAHEHDH